MDQITHKGTGTSGQSIKTWTFDWTAPGFATSTGYEIGVHFSC